MDTNEHFLKYGTRIRLVDAADIRRALGERTREEKVQGAGDTELMRLYCVQLFSLGLPEDILEIWAAKSASLDAGCSIGVQLLCGSGLEETKEYLQSIESSFATAALKYIIECEQAGDFYDFDREKILRANDEYYD